MIMNEEKLDIVDEHVLLEMMLSISKSNCEIKSLISGIDPGKNYAGDLKIHIAELTDRLSHLKSRKEKFNFDIDYIRKLIQDMESNHMTKYDRLRDRDIYTMKLTKEEIPKLEASYESKLSKLMDLEDRLHAARERNRALRAEKGVSELAHSAPRPPEHLYRDLNKLQRQTKLFSGMLQLLDMQTEKTEEAEYEDP